MKELTPKVKGKADMGKVSSLIKEKISKWNESFTFYLKLN
jgi:hypothetical protein